jgi:TRAP-type C4-dicarboxylate transport system permease small subunit
MKIFIKLDNLIASIERRLIILSLSTIALLTFLNVVFRALYLHFDFIWANRFLGKIDWADPLARLLVLWVTILGASLLTGENKHIRIDVFSSFLKGRLYALREIILSLVCVAICIQMFWASINYISLEIEFGANVLLGIPSWIGQIILPAGFAVISFRYLLRAVNQTLLLFKNRQV